MLGVLLASIVAAAAASSWSSLVRIVDSSNPVKNIEIMVIYWERTSNNVARETSASADKVLRLGGMG